MWSKTFLFICAASAIPNVETALQFNRRMNPTTPTITSSGYVVPLEGSKTCQASTQNSCKTSLPPPPANKSLKYITLARGVTNYSCAGRGPTQAPLLLNQDTTLWDAEPLITHLPNEQGLHRIVPSLYEFDYTMVKNSSLTCIGAVNSTQTGSEVEIYSDVKFSMYAQDHVDSPSKPDFDLQWTHLISLDLTWDIYRVETVGGASPATCEKVNSIFELGYAAEFWFYHA